ncbi:hypothetical protein LTR15_011783 [Elasticomyces elasticus]|nr:hypothetical protein LTR15_011783 [Elasticomyces elasticus]
MSHGTKRAAPDAQEAAWVADEDRFVLQQAKKKAALRVKGGRAAPLDWLAVTLLVIDPERNPLDDEVEVDDIDLRAPENVLDSLGAKELAEVEKGIEGYEVLESSRSNVEYWQTMKTVCADRRKTLQSTNETSARGVSSISGDLDKLLGPKTLPELEKLEKQVKGKLASDEPIDTDYWEHLLGSLVTYKAKTRLSKVTDRILEARLRTRQDEEDDEAAITGADLVKRIAEERQKSQEQGFIPGRKRLANQSVADDGDDGSPSAKRQRTDDSPASALVPGPNQSAAQSAFDRDLARTLASNEDLLTTEEPLITKSISTWTAAPRKPRYFARVITGYEWNKYNQTHYSADEPPPKVVQGYKFNILYPDLVNTSKAPTYKIERADGRRRGEMSAPSGEDDTCVIRFVAGEPYEDLGFRIVDKEWDFSAKRERGFKSRFEGGVLQLWFQFKKIYYRK